MKKKLFSCFHPLPLETETDQINVVPDKKLLKISCHRHNSKRPFSEFLEFLLLKASLKIKFSDRKVSLHSKNARLRRIRHLQNGGDDKNVRKKGVEEARVSHTEVETSYRSKSTTASFNDERKPCLCNEINPFLYLLVVTLFLTVVWGRGRAVLFELVILYLFPTWAGFLRRSENVERLPAK